MLETRLSMAHNRSSDTVSDRDGSSPMTRILTTAQTHMHMHRVAGLVFHRKLRSGQDLESLTGKNLIDCCNKTFYRWIFISQPCQKHQGTITCHSIKQRALRQRKSPSESNQFLLVAHPTPVQKNCIKFDNNFLSYPANRQTDRQTNAG